MSRTVTTSSQVSAQPAYRKTRTNDSDTLIAGFQSYECPVMKARFFGSTVDEAKLKATQAIRDAQTHDRIITPDKDFVAKRKKAKWQSKPVAVREPRETLPIGRKVNEWEVVSECYQKAMEEGGKVRWRVDCQCSCGIVISQLLHTMIKKPSRECADCSKARVGAIKSAAALKRKQAHIDSLNGGQGVWRFTSGIYKSDQKAHMIDAVCPNGHTKKFNVNYIMDDGLQGCARCPRK